MFVRFSTVAGERGSADTVRDTRGFAVKFYTREGNWDLVGNNIPVFFIQDAMKFPDVVHAVKPEPHHQMPQASSAHDTFWDFISLMPESVHHTMWVMSDRGIPRSYRTMQGFGVHSYRLVNVAGEAETAALQKARGPAGGYVPELDPEALNGTNLLRLFVFGNDAAQQVRLLALLDNLGKGASGAAVQNLNLMLGLDEGAGLKG